MKYQIEKVNIETVKLNPRNPRKITDEMFEKLKDSINNNPKLLALNPLKIDENGVIIGGNMRYLALQKLGHKEIYVIRASDFTEEEKKRAVILDNISFGFWDFDMLGADYEQADLLAMGMTGFQLGIDDDEPEPDNLTAGKNDKKPTIKITCETTEQLEAVKVEVEVIMAKYPGTLLSVSAGEL